MTDFFDKINEEFDSYYEDTWRECEEGEKAKKDIVGSNYEEFKGGLNLILT